MKQQNIIIGVALLLILLIAGAWWFNAPGQPVPKPKLFKAQGLPPKTPEHKALWEWWNYMDKTDPSFQWKMPIEFHGKVVDQNGDPVADATVIMTWASLGGTRGQELKSDAQGLFSITGIHGKRLNVKIYKDRHVAGVKANVSFEYAAFYENIFHVDEPDKPVIFELWKLGDSEPMYQWSPTIVLKADGTPMGIDFHTGKKGGEDLVFSVIHNNKTAMNKYDYVMTISAPGGFVHTDEEMMFMAPESGYKQTLVITEKYGEPGYKQIHKFRFYVRTVNGQYAAVQATVRQHGDYSAQVQLVVFFNPSGSRNLEYDYKKKINK